MFDYKIIINNKRNFFLLGMLALLVILLPFVILSSNERQTLQQKAAGGDLILRTTQLRYAKNVPTTVVWYVNNYSTTPKEINVVDVVFGYDATELTITEPTCLEGFSSYSPDQTSLSAMNIVCGKPASYVTVPASGKIDVASFKVVLNSDVTKVNQNSLVIGGKDSNGNTADLSRSTSQHIFRVDTPEEPTPTPTATGTLPIPTPTITSCLYTDASKNCGEDIIPANGTIKCSGGLSVSRPVRSCSSDCATNEKCSQNFQLNYVNGLDKAPEVVEGEIGCHCTKGCGTCPIATSTPTATLTPTLVPVKVSPGSISYTNDLCNIAMNIEWSGVSSSQLPLSYQTYICTAPNANCTANLVRTNLSSLLPSSSQILNLTLPRTTQDRYLRTYVYYNGSTSVVGDTSVLCPKFSVLPTPTPTVPACIARGGEGCTYTYSGDPLKTGCCTGLVCVQSVGDGGLNQTNCVPKCPDTGECVESANSCRTGFFRNNDYGCLYGTNLVCCTASVATPTVPAGKGGIEGYVFSDVNGNGNRDSVEIGIKDVVVRLMNSTGTTQIGQTKTSSSGYYGFLNITASVAGTVYQVKIDVPTSHTTPRNPISNVVVKSGQATSTYVSFPMSLANQDACSLRFKGDLNCSGLIDCADWALMRQALGKATSSYQGTYENPGNLPTGYKTSPNLSSVGGTDVINIFDAEIVRSNVVNMQTCTN